MFLMTHVNNCRQKHRNLVRDHKQSVLSCFLSLFPRFSLSLCHFTPSASLLSSFCVSLLQEGQVLECSLINSIRVGAVPKVRPQKKTISSLSVSTTFTLSAHPRSIQSLTPTETLRVKSDETATSDTLLML